MNSKSRGNDAAFDAALSTLFINDFESLGIGGFVGPTAIGGGVTATLPTLIPRVA